MVEYKMVLGFSLLTEADLNVLGADNWYLIQAIGDTGYFVKVVPWVYPLATNSNQ